MPLAAGDKLGPYEILGPLGEGGMGAVYRARDTRLGRDVAIKISSAQFTDRFEREGRAVAALNHPNICHLYDVGALPSGAGYLVMELIEGQTLTERIRQGPIPMEEALRIAAQIRDALEAAHDKLITHRDLKPGNVMLTSGASSNDVVKVLDFGLAKQGREVAASSSTNPRSPTMSPTLSIAATEAGMILGTAAYMAPEQAKGRPVDKRADIWAFGVVLYEMLTGERPFHGEDVGDIMASVIKEQPKFEKLPAKVRLLIESCLEKDPKNRLRDIGDAWKLLDAGSQLASLQNRDREGASTAPSPSRLGKIAIAAAVILALATAALGFVHFRETPPEQPRVQFGIPLPGKATNAAFEISPDGRFLAIVGFDGTRTQLWIRPLDSGETRVLAGTEGATYPFWSPDGAYIGFFAGGKLKKIAVSGGSPQTLCETSYTQGGTWNQEGVILVAGRGLKRVSAAGGVPVDVTTVAPGDPHVYPVFLPGGRRFLFTMNGDRPETIGIYVGSLDGTPPVRLVPDYSSAAYVPGTASERNGFLLFRRGTTLMAQPFDPSHAQLSGEVFPVAEQVGVSMNIGHGAFSASPKGVLVYRSGAQTDTHELVWRDRSGKRLGVLGKPGLIRSAVLSPDEKQVALDIADPQAGNYDIWLLNITRGAMSRFTFGPGQIGGPVWAPDGGSIVFSSRAGSYLRDLYRKPVSGAGGQELLVRAAGRDAFPYDWSRDGKFLVYGWTDEKTKRDLWLLPMDGARKPVPYLEEPYWESLGQFSPDGKWMAYVSDQSGTDQVYIHAIPPTRPPVQASIAGGTEPRWRRDGRELFYVSADQKLTAVPIRLAGTGVEAGTPQPLFDFAGATNTFLSNYQPTADGQRFLMLVPPADEAPAPITVVLNWQAGLKK